MRYIPVSKLMPGMAIGQEIFSGRGDILFAIHSLLTKDTILMLKEMGYAGVYIDDTFTQGMEIQQVISPEIRRETLRAVHNIYLTEAAIGSEEERHFHKSIEDVVEDLLTNGDVMCNMVDIKSYDDYIYYHSVNVALISAMMGCKLGLTKEEIKDLTAAALLHDIGKKFVDAKILKAPRALTEEEIPEMVQHPKLGCEYLRKNFNFKEEILRGVLEHHEWMNGEGYPLRKSAEEISLYGRIIKIADAYDAMTSKTPYRKSMQPADAVEYIMAMAGVEFDLKLVNVFLGCIAVYPIGCEVILSNGEHAVVMRNYNGFVLRPRLKLLETAKTIDLKEDKEARNLTIVELIV